MLSPCSSPRSLFSVPGNADGCVSERGEEEITVENGMRDHVVCDEKRLRCVRGWVRGSDREDPAYSTQPPSRVADSGGTSAVPRSISEDPTCSLFVDTYSTCVHVVSLQAAAAAVSSSCTHYRPVQVLLQITILVLLYLVSYDKAVPGS